MAARTATVLIIFLTGALDLGLAWSPPAATTERRIAPSRGRRRRHGGESPGGGVEALLSRTADAAAAATGALPRDRLTANHVRQLKEDRYVVIPHFLAESVLDALRADVQTLREGAAFRAAKIGQDSTHALNADIRVAETCFLGPTRLSRHPPSAARTHVYAVLDAVRRDLAAAFAAPLDPTLTELLYASYPQGGYYRRHRDAVPGSVSTLRKYSLLLYLNKDWNMERDGGALRLHFDSGGGDELAPGQEPDYIDVEPAGGTLLLFQSDALPHEVRDTVRERLAIVGWYNRPVQLSDAVELSGGTNGNAVQVVAMAVALGLVTVGVLGLMS